MNGTPLFLAQRSQDLICEWCHLRSPEYQGSACDVDTIISTASHIFFLFSWKWFLSNSSISSLKLHNSREVGLGAVRPFESWQWRFVCATLHTGRRLQLDRQVHKDNGTGRGVTMRDWASVKLSQATCTQTWISDNLTRKISRHRKRSSGRIWFRFPQNYHAYAHGKYLHNLLDKRLAQLTYSILQNTGTLWT